MESLIGLWIVLTIFAVYYGHKRGQSVIFCLIISVFLSPLIAFIAIALTKPKTEVVEARELKSGKMKRCPHCAELVRKEARVCKHCQQSFAPKSPAASNVSTGIGGDYMN